VIFKETLGVALSQWRKKGELQGICWRRFHPYIGVSLPLRRPGSTGSRGSLRCAAARRRLLGRGTREDPEERARRDLARSPADPALAFCSPGGRQPSPRPFPSCLHQSAPLFTLLVLQVSVVIFSAQRARPVRNRRMVLKMSKVGTSLHLYAFQKS
jgi:hypothetical protein